MMAKIGKIYFAAILVFILLLPSRAFCSNSIMNIRHWAAPDHTRIVFDTSDEPQYSVEKKDQLVVIDFADTALSQDVTTEINLKKPDPCRIHLTKMPENNVRVEITLPANVSSNVFKLKKFQDKPDRLVIDIESPDIKKQETEEREQIKVSRKAKIIIIDPGHGGEDPGAVGKRRTLEKDIVLSIGKKLRDILNKKKGYRAFMTRDGDYYVSFKKRTTIAREYGADLFVSIHADAALNRYAKGSSVYCLSVSGASSEAAKILARNENLADLVGGSPNGENNDQSDPIVLNMFQTNTINVSRTFGYSVLKHLNNICHLKFYNVQEAPFRVLKLPEIPSILVETAYISNPKEERLLRNNKFQTALAEAMSRSITEFLSKPPSILPVIELVKDNKAIPDFDDSEKQKTQNAASRDDNIYIVKKGDSLGRIALDHGATLSALLKLNNMKLKDNLYVGRKLYLTAPVEALEKESKETKSAEKAKPQPPANPAISIYKVKKGDSLDKIAREHDTTLSALLKLNNMKLKDPLYAGKLIKINKGDIVEAESIKSNSPVKDTHVIAKAKRRTHYYTYKVKKGDTIDIIAKRHKVSANVILSLNNMQRSHPLLIDQKLKLPQNSIP